MRLGAMKMAKMILKEYLKERGIKSNYVCGRTGINQSSFSRIMNNNCETLRFDHLQKICEVLQCEISDILVLDKSPLMERLF